MTITVSSTDCRDGKALALFSHCADWQQGKTKDGRSFFAIPGSQPNLYHMTDARECSCPDFQRSRNICKHVRAVRLWMAAFRTGAVSPKREARTVTTAQDDLVILMPEGAAHLAALAAQDQAEAAANDPHAECVVTDETRAAHAKLLAEQDQHVRTLRLLGYGPEDYIESGAYSQRAEHIARLAACIGHAVA